MDTGGLAQMTYNNFSNDGNLAVPGSGFASRGKGGHIKRLSFAPPPRINSIYEEDADSNTTLRTNRSQLLAGLRTAPKQHQVPASAPYNQTHHRFASDASGYNARNNARLGQDVPQTAVGSGFPGLGYNQYNMGNGQQPYCFPDQVLAPPDRMDNNGEQMDPQLYNELMATNLYLVQRQQQLQQQLLNVTAAAQQFQGLNLNAGHQLPVTPITPQMSVYNQQLQNGMQPVIQPVPNQPGLYSVYNPMTGQHSYVMDSNAQQTQLSSSPPYTSSSSGSDNIGFYRQDTLTPQAAYNTNPNVSVTPPKKSASPAADVAPLPPPSANAFRPGHRKSSSIGYTANTSKNFALQDGLRSAGPRSAAFPQTPTTGTFGLGMGRAGEHPTRQPRGPPPLEELVACPTSKHEGSKNFATRQRRRALNSLVRAGNERRTGRASGGAGTPSSEGDINFTVSDADLDATSTGFPGLGGLRASANGAIGSEWKELKERSRDRSLVSRHLTGSSFGGNENGFGGK